MQENYNFLSESYDYNKVSSFYGKLRDRQKSFVERYNKGEDLDKLIEECWQMLIG